MDLWVHPSWRDFRDAIARERCLYFSARAERPLAEAVFRPNSVLVFGNESDGMPDRILQKHPDRCFRIPMPGEAVRSLNLATAVGIVVYHALESLGIEPPQPPDSAPPPRESPGPRRPARGRPRSRRG